MPNSMQELFMLARHTRHLLGIGIWAFIGHWDLGIEHSQVVRIGVLVIGHPLAIQYARTSTAPG